MSKILAILVFVVSFAIVPAIPANAASCRSLPVPSSAAVMVSEIQFRLAALGYPLTPDGNPGPKTRMALKLWESKNRRLVNGRVESSDLLVLRKQTAGSYSVRVNKATQKMTVSKNNRSFVTLPVSTGSGKMFKGKTGMTRAVTPSGTFKVFRRQSGWYQSYLGCLYAPSFFNGGIALHGSLSVPRYPASHGCVRVGPTLATMAGLNKIIQSGSVVVVS